MHQIKIFTGAGAEWPGNIEDSVNEFLKKNPRIIIHSMVHTQHLEGSSVTILYSRKTKTKED